MSCSKTHQRCAGTSEILIIECRAHYSDAEFGQKFIKTGNKYFCTESTLSKRKACSVYILNMNIIIPNHFLLVKFSFLFVFRISMFLNFRVFYQWPGQNGKWEVMNWFFSSQKSVKLMQILKSFRETLSWNSASNLLKNTTKCHPENKRIGMFLPH